ncbi:hypothetical protein B0H10DRAFT_1991603 [Mycena sp. CBHHK59/15]|nr:hypothetical protein B0H10DRAFT_1991603 [Mycena sp. CBHHK59/15]
MSSLLPPSPPSTMSAIFPRRGRRDDSDAGESYVDLSPPPPMREKRRRHSPFAYLRNWKRSTERSKTLPPQESATDSVPLPPVPPLFGNHNRNYSDPELVYGRQVRSPGSSSESMLHIPSPPPRRAKLPTHFGDAPSAENFLPGNNGAAPILTAAAMMSVAQSTELRRSILSPEQPPGSERAPGAAVHAGDVLQTLQLDKAIVTKKVGPLIDTGLVNLTKAQTIVDEVVASEAWSVAKEQATTVLAPAKDVLVILDSVTKYIPALMVAESVFSVIIKHEIEKKENDKNILVVYHTMSIFWFTLCDVQVIFRAAQQIKTSLDTFFEAVAKTMQDFGNFREVYYRHGHFARSVRSSEYRKKLTAFAQAFADHKSSLQFILTESSAMKVNEMSGNLNAMNAKIDQVLQYVARQTPLEQAIAQQIQENGGAEVALQNPQFLGELARKTFGEELSPQAHASIRQDLDEALNANLAAFTLKAEASKNEIMEAMERSADVIAHQLNSGPYQLIKDEDIQAVWKGTNWGLSCKARHFVDAVHNHFAQKFRDHRHQSGAAHPELWTLNVLSQVIYFGNIADAIDDDGSGYISVQEVNQFFKKRPKEWSAVQWLSFWAAGWKQNAVDYKSRCIGLFTNLEASAKKVLPQNRRYVKSYLKTSGLSELWLVVNSLNTDAIEHSGRPHAAESEPLYALRTEIMRKNTEHIQSRLDRILYQLESPETVVAVLGTHRLEGFVLCLLQLILERHQRIMEVANTLVLSEREFQSMSMSLRNLVVAFKCRYHTLTESWKQQRLDTNFLVQCFSGGIFNEWHEVLQDHPSGLDKSENAEISQVTRVKLDDERPHGPEDLLLFPLPPQPTSTEIHDITSEDNSPARSLTHEHRARGRHSVKHSRGNLHSNSSSASDYFYQFDFERRPSEAEMPHEDPDRISQVYRKKPKLEDRITALETELSEIKGMLSQLVLLSSPRSDL